MLEHEATLGAKRPGAFGLQQFGTVLFVSLKVLANEAFHRVAIARMQNLEDHRLADLGLTRSDLLAALRLPLQQSAGAFLEDCRCHRANKPMRAG